MSAIRKTHLEKIQDGIVEALKQGGLSAKYRIEPFPDDPDKFDMADAEKVALVQYVRSNYGRAESANSAAQMRDAHFSIHLYLRRASTPVNGMHEIDQVRLCLQGRVVEGAELSMLRDGLVDQNGALWRYVVEVSAPIPAIPLNREQPTPFVTEFHKGGA